MKAEILAVGDELLTGAIVDTNSAFIAGECGILGLEVTRHSCVGDRLGDVTRALKELGERADIGIVTGGLGPTFDDLTRDGAALASGKRLELHEEAMEAIEGFFKSVNLTMVESNRRQALFPEGSLYLPNPIGTAPGFALPIGKALIFFTPGVPREMKLMFKEQVLPRIIERFKDQLKILHVLTLNTFGMTEALIGQHLEAIEKRFPDVKYGTRFHFPEIQIKLYARGEKGPQLIQQAKKAVEEILGDWIFGEDDQSMEDVLDQLIDQKKVSYSITETEQENFTNHSDKSYHLKMHKIFDARTIEIDLDGEKYSYTVPFGDKERQRSFFSTLALDLLRRKILNKKALKDVFEKD
jgi:nicotinamide-nucleotide amidase